MVMFAAISYPAIEAMYSGVKVDAAADSVRTAWSEARPTPSTRAAPIASPSFPARGTTASPPTVPSSGREAATAMADPDNPAYVLENSLPKGIVFPDEGGRARTLGERLVVCRTAPSARPVDDPVTFLPDGTAQDDAEVFLQWTARDPPSSRCAALTGTMTVQRGE